MLPASFVERETCDTVLVKEIDREVLQDPSGSRGWEFFWLLVCLQLVAGTAAGKSH